MYVTRREAFGFLIGHGIGCIAVIATLFLMGENISLLVDSRTIHRHWLRELDTRTKQNHFELRQLKERVDLWQTK